MLASGEPVFGPLDDEVEAVFGGLPRNSMPTTLQGGVLLYYLLPPLWAHVANEVLIRAIAFFGLFLLLRRHALPGAPGFLVAGASLCFALQPVMLIGYASTLGLPLLLYALVNLHERRGSAVDWAIVALFPFYSLLIYVGFFLLLLLGLFLAWELVRERRLDGRLVAAGVLLGLGYAVSEYRLLYQTFLDPDYVSYRAEFVRFHGGIVHAALRALGAFFTSHPHAAGLQTPFVLGTLALAGVLGARELRGRGAAGLRRAMRDGLHGESPLGGALVATLACAGLALFIGAWSWTPVQRAIEAAPGPVRSFNFHRLSWFATPLFAVGFAMALEVVRRALGRRGRAVVLALLAAQVLWAVWSSDGLAEQRRSGLTFRGYYAPALFADVRDAIGRPQGDYHVVSFGMTPAIALYDGFQVLDGIVQDYPLSHKHAFRRVIARELAKDEGLRTWYDHWGGHVDLMSSELGRVSGYARHVYTRDAAIRRVEHLEIDVDALRELGADYVLAAVEIGNHEALGLEPLGTFERDDAPWRITVYAVPARVPERSEGAP